MRSRQVAALLRGGQACVFYGAAEFSKDTDFAILAEPENLARLRAALGDLGAERIAVPPFAAEYLERGHAVHFRCQHARPGALVAAAAGDVERTEAALADEQARERARDRAYWEPLKRELEDLRRQRA